MNRTYLRCGVIVLAVLLVVGALVFTNRVQPAFGAAEQADKAGGGPRYTVVETEGHNLVVTDNGNNILYFYTVDKGESPGADLKLRASLDLNEVGKPVLKPKDINIQKK
jgi:hypothetical protein